MKLYEDFKKWWKEYSYTLGAITVAPSVPSNRMLINAKLFSSRGAAFVLAVFGVISQTFHTGFLLYDYSSISSEFVRVFNATILAMFFSSGLLYFTLKSDDVNTKYKNAVYWFALFDSFVNISYYFNKLVWISGHSSGSWSYGDVHYFEFIISIPFSIMLPVVMKIYGGEIRVVEAMDKIVDFTSDLTLDKTKAEKFKLQIETLIKKSFTEFGENVDTRYATSTEFLNFKKVLKRYISMLSNKTSKLNIADNMNKLNETIILLKNHIDSVYENIKIETKEVIDTVILDINNDINNFKQEIDLIIRNTNNQDTNDLQSNIDTIKSNLKKVNKNITSLQDQINKLNVECGDNLGNTLKDIVNDISGIKNNLKECINYGDTLEFNKDGSKTSVIVNKASV